MKTAVFTVVLICCVLSAGWDLRAMSIMLICFQVLVLSKHPGLCRQEGFGAIMETAIVRSFAEHWHLHPVATGFWLLRAWHGGRSSKFRRTWKWSEHTENTLFIEV